MRKRSFVLLLPMILVAVGCGSGSNSTSSGSNSSGSATSGDSAPIELLNVSYDPTRELWKDLNEKFTAQQQSVGKSISIKQSHGGSGSQARAVILSTQPRDFRSSMICSRNRRGMSFCSAMIRIEIGPCPR